MKYVMVTGAPRHRNGPQMEVMSEDGTTLICQNSKNNYPETGVSSASAAVTDENTIVACGGGK